MREAGWCVVLSIGVAAILFAFVPGAEADPGLPWCPDPEPDDDGFFPCPCPSCMAPCVFPAEPQGECKAPDGTVSESTFTCCCCGGSIGWSFRSYGTFLELGRFGEGSMLTWTDVAGADTYDIVRGDLGALREDGFGAATSDCLDNDNSGTSLVVAETPSPGETIWFLIRSEEGGSYDSGGGSQVAARDEVIAESGNDCP